MLNIIILNLGAEIKHFIGGGLYNFDIALEFTKSGFRDLRSDLPSAWIKVCGLCHWNFWVLTSLAGFGFVILIKDFLVILWIFKMIYGIIIRRFKLNDTKNRKNKKIAIGPIIMSFDVDTSGIADPLLLKLWNFCQVIRTCRCIFSIEWMIINYR